jgi:hypothetical protein
MSETSIILLYSTRSNACDLFREKFIRAIANMHSVCIDSQYVRNKITNSNIIVKQVPCILVVNSNGGIETYNGKHAFNLMSSLTRPQHRENTATTEVFVPPEDFMSMKTPIEAQNHTNSAVNKSVDRRDGYGIDVSDESQIKVIKGVKSANSAPDLMTTAQAMQKARELDMENIRPVSSE